MGGRDIIWEGRQYHLGWGGNKKMRKRKFTCTNVIGKAAIMGFLTGVNVLLFKANNICGPPVRTLDVDQG